jgi:predicted MFS family arabinose efflux permease
MLTVTQSAGSHRPSPGALAVCGSATVAVAFGFARYGFGLFVPAFRAEFGVGTRTIGVIGSATYGVYLAALLGSGWLTARRGPRLPVVLGAASASTGMALVAIAPSAPVLIAGLALAASSAGWVWAPFADAVAMLLPAAPQPWVLAVISTGTTFGLGIAGPVALLCGDGRGSWRWAWGVFAAAAAAAATAAARLLPGAPSQVMVGAGRAARRRFRSSRAAMPLLGLAALYGAVASVYYTFAVDLVRIAGLGPRWSAMLWTLVGVGGLSGVGTGGLVRVLGLRRSIGICLFGLAGAIAALAAVPSNPVGAGCAAALFGLAYMPVAALLALWNLRVHPEAPTSGFTVVLCALAAGSMAGPVVLGLLAANGSLRVVFVVLAALTLAGLGLRPAAEVSRW